MKKGKKVDNKKFLKITFLVILAIVIVFVGLDMMNNKYKFLKPEYGINENAIIDDINLKLTNVKYINIPICTLA